MTKYGIKYYRHEHCFASFIKQAKYVFSVGTAFVLEFRVVSVGKTARTVNGHCIVKWVMDLWLFDLLSLTFGGCSRGDYGLTIRYR